MLRIAKLGLGGEGYYLQSVGLEPEGVWLGEGKAAAGLGELVEPAHMTALLEGRDPASGDLLGGARNRVKVTAFDLTFAAPKSVSVLQALADSPVAEDVASCHQQAVTAAIEYAEKRALAVRRSRNGERTVEEIQGAFAAAFLHRTSRALDPHLHTHVVVANVGQSHDHKFSALDGRGIYAHAGAIGALYHSQLRYELRERLGVEWGPLDRGRADLMGIGVEVRREFSRRSAQIASDLASSGLKGSRAADVASRKTRQPKDLTLGPDQLRPEWRKRALEVGLSPGRLEAVLERIGPSSRRGVDSGVDLGDAARVQERAILRLASEGRPVTRRRAVQAVCLDLPEGADSPKVERVADDLLVALDRRGHERGRDGPGVTERRLPLEDLELSPMARRAAEIAVERRQAVDRALTTKAYERGRELRYETGLGLG